MTENLSKDAYSRLGAIARELHDALRELGHADSIERIAQDVPEARERLDYVATLTEQAASSVLNAVDAGKPECAAVRSQGRDLAEALRKMATEGVDPKRCATMLRLCADYAERAAGFADHQDRLLTDIMMAQGFQDLTGQIVKKVSAILARTERDLIELLMAEQRAQAEAQGEAPAEAKAPAAFELEVPQVAGKALKQDDVDNLLASLGF